MLRPLRPSRLSLGSALRTGARCLLFGGLGTTRAEVAQGQENRSKGLAAARQSIVDVRRNLGVIGPHHKTIGLQVTELLDQHLVRNAGKAALQLGEPQHRPFE